MYHRLAHGRRRLAEIAQERANSRIATEAGERRYAVVQRVADLVDRNTLVAIQLTTGIERIGLEKQYAASAEARKYSSRPSSRSSVRNTERCRSASNSATIASAAATRGARCAAENTDSMTTKPSRSNWLRCASDNKKAAPGYTVVRVSGATHPHGKPSEVDHRCLVAARLCRYGLVQIGRCSDDRAVCRSDTIRLDTGFGQCIREAAR